MDKTMKLIQINKGNSPLYNHMDQLQDIIVQNKPSILIINELNSHNGDSTCKNNFANYRMETDGLDITDQTARTGMLIHNSIHYVSCRDLESMGTSTIWVQLKYPGCKPVLIQALYRQFQ